MIFISEAEPIKTKIAFIPVSDGTCTTVSNGYRIKLTDHEVNLVSKGAANLFLTSQSNLAGKSLNKLNQLLISPIYFLTLAFDVSLDMNPMKTNQIKLTVKIQNGR